MEINEHTFPHPGSWADRQTAQAIYQFKGILQRPHTGRKGKGAPGREKGRLEPSHCSGLQDWPKGEISFIFLLEGHVTQIICIHAVGRGTGTIPQG